MQNAFHFEMGKYRYQPNLDFMPLNFRDYIISQHTLAAIVGVIAIGMPVLMLLGSLGLTCSYDSISHYYYSHLLGDVFVGSLVIIGTFLIAYRGENRQESLYASIAGICSYGVAVFPTTKSGLETGAVCAGRAFYRSDITDPPYFFELFPSVGILHYGSAALLFLFLAYYSMRVFTRIIYNIHEDGFGNLLPQKRIRNNLYICSGIVILFCMAFIGVNAYYDFPWWQPNNLTFWFEALALWAFGISWVVKGRFFNTALRDKRDFLAGSKVQ
jgi:hypothetical protein